MRVRVPTLLLFMLVATGTWAEKRAALVIGNADYTQQSRLSGSIRDARAMAATLRLLGFETILRLNLNEDALHKALADFGTVLDRVDVGLVYFSGHGAQGERGGNYILPLDVRDLFSLPPLLSLRGIRRMMNKASNQVNIIILDACRNLPGSLARGSGLAHPKSFRPVSDDTDTEDDIDPFLILPPQGNGILFASAPGTLSWEGIMCPQYDGHGCYTGELLKALDLVFDRPGLALNDVHMMVRNGVMQSTNNEQRPWYNQGLNTKFYFHPFGSKYEATDIIQRRGEMIPPRITDPEQIQILLKIRASQASRYAETEGISFREAVLELYGKEAGRLLEHLGHLAPLGH